VRLTYDPQYNTAYIRFGPKTSDVESIRIGGELVIDIAPDGTVYGIELLNANEQLQREDMGELIVVNEATGEHTNLPLMKAKTG
jgi:uncharacterized protein YuzE